MFFLGALSSLFIALVGNCTDRVYDLLTERENKFSVTLFVKAAARDWRPTIGAELNACVNAPTNISGQSLVLLFVLTCGAVTESAATVFPRLIALVSSNGDRGIQLKCNDRSGNIRLLLSESFEKRFSVSRRDEN
ncbi:hypothetical protein OUZ56_006021 [Daphnia magna]|uniref:Uncharacterized protein n=1 Tax=Daphnia magna TaxID=35525 RepID=A0ABQ9YUE4_9CRUS|nr:hypothetical protein OUZ56_006021 [Daphnia magna]